MRLYILLATALMISSGVYCEEVNVSSFEYDENEKIIHDLALRKNESTIVLISLLMQESGNPKENFKINPYALNVGGLSLYPDNKLDAYEKIVSAMMTGTKQLGVGIGQLEWRFHSNKFDNAWNALDVTENLLVSIDYYKKMKGSCNGRVRCAVSSYHNRKKEVGEKYLAKVRERCNERFGPSSCGVLYD